MSEYILPKHSSLAHILEARVDRSGAASSPSLEISVGFSLTLKEISDFSWRRRILLSLLDLNSFFLEQINELQAGLVICLRRTEFLEILQIEDILTQPPINFLFFSGSVTPARPSKNLLAPSTIFRLMPKCSARVSLTCWHSFRRMTPLSIKTAWNYA